MAKKATKKTTSKKTTPKKEVVEEVVAVVVEEAPKPSIAPPRLTRGANLSRRKSAWKQWSEETGQPIPVNWRSL